LSIPRGATPGSWPGSRRSLLAGPPRHRYQRHTQVCAAPHVYGALSFGTFARGRWPWNSVSRA